MYTTSPEGKRIYTLQKVVGSTVTKSAHPARFSPDDKYSRHRVTLKKRYALLLTQQSEFSPLFFICAWKKRKEMVFWWEVRLGLISVLEDLIVLGQ